MKQLTFTTEQRTVGELIPATYNPRKMTAKENADLTESLEKFGFVEIPVINTDGTILAGHQRVRIACDLYGRDYTVDVRVPNRTLTEEEEKEYNIRSNKNTGSWDWDKLANEFDTTELINWGFENWEIGFSKETKAEKNKEIDLESLDNDTFTLKITFTSNTQYLDALESLQNAQLKLSLSNSGDTLSKLLESY